MIRIELTAEQAEALACLQAEVDKACLSGLPGAILAQVSPLYGYIECRFVTNEEVKKMYSALDYPEPK